MEIESAEFEEALIERVRPHEMLYSTKKSTFHLNKQKSIIWARIAVTLDKDKTKVLAKWTAMKNKFKREYNREKDSRSGDGAETVYTSDWPAYKSLFFLKDTFEPEKPYESNLSGLYQNQQAEETSRKEDFSPEREYASTTAHLELPREKPKMGSEPPINVNRKFFETMLPLLKNMKPEDTLKFRTELNAAVQEFAFPNRKQSTKRRFNHENENIDVIDISGDDDVPVPIKPTIKREKTQDRDSKESMSLELAKLRKDLEEMRRAKVPYPMVYPNYNMAMDGYNGMIPDQLNPMQPHYGVPLNNVHDEIANAANNQEHQGNQDEIEPWY